MTWTNKRSSKRSSRWLIWSRPILFIFGLKGLTHPRTAVRGNLLGALGMAVAIVATLIHQDVAGYWLIGIGVVIGGGAGVVLAKKIQMTAMPQMVALFNGFGGGASVLVAGAEFVTVESADATTSFAVSGLLAGLIGAVTFWGSLVAFAKLQEYKKFKKPIEYPARQLIQRGARAAGAVVVGSRCDESDQRVDLRPRGAHFLGARLPPWSIRSAGPTCRWSSRC